MLAQLRWLEGEVLRYCRLWQFAVVLLCACEGECVRACLPWSLQPPCSWPLGCCKRGGKSLAVPWALCSTATSGAAVGCIEESSASAAFLVTAFLMEVLGTPLRQPMLRIKPTSSGLPNHYLSSPLAFFREYTVEDFKHQVCWMYWDFFLIY